MKKEIHRKEFFGTALVLLTAFISGFSIIANKFFVVTIDPLIFTATRALFIGIIFLFISLYFYGSKDKVTFKDKKTSWWSLVLIGLIGGSFAFWLFFTGLKMGLGIRAAFLHKTLPIYAAILAFVFLKEKISKKQLIAMGVMFAGLVVMELMKLSYQVRMGDILVLSATVLWAVENVISKKVMERESNWVVTFARMFFGSIILFAIIFLMGKGSLILALTSQQMIYILVSGILLFMYVLTWYWGLKHINLSKASSILLLAPVVSLIFGITWLGEEVAALQMIGSVLILVGGFFLVRVKSEKRK